MSTLAPSGYSGTPLAQKLGYKAGCVALAIDAPREYRSWLRPLPEGVSFVDSPGANCHLVHLFAVERDALATQLVTLRTLIGPSAAVWVSWPKKASKVPTSITEDVIRALALPLGFVDIKVCAVSEVWSGLKLVVRKELRS
jgi:hypothetical protein